MKRLGVALLGLSGMFLIGFGASAGEDVLSNAQAEMVIEEEGILEEEIPGDVVQEEGTQAVEVQGNAPQEVNPQEVSPQEPGTLGSAAQNQMVQVEENQEGMAEEIPVEPILTYDEVLSLVSCGDYGFHVPGFWEKVSWDGTKIIRFTTGNTTIRFERMEGNLFEGKDVAEAFLSQYASNLVQADVHRLSLDFYGMEETTVETTVEATTEWTETTTVGQETTTERVELSTERAELSSENATSSLETETEYLPEKGTEIQTVVVTETETELTTEAITETMEAPLEVLPAMSGASFPSPSVYGKYSFGNWYNNRGRFEGLVLPLNWEQEVLCVSLIADYGEAQQHISSFREMVENMEVFGAESELTEEVPSEENVFEAASGEEVIGAEPVEEIIGGEEVIGEEVIGEAEPGPGPEENILEEEAVEIIEPVEVIGEVVEEIG